MSTDLFPVSVDVMIDEVRREISKRRQVYPKLVANQQMSGRAATRRIEILEAVLRLLEEQLDAANDRQGAATAGRSERPGADE